MADRCEDTETPLLQGPDKMADNSIEDICCFGMVRSTTADIFVCYLDIPHLQSATHYLNHLQN